MMRLIAGVLILILIAGCATVKAAPGQAKTREQITQDRAECAEAATKAAGSNALKEGALTGGIVGAWLILAGAADGATWGVVTGGSASDGAWIGAAVGAGIGTIVGVVVGIKKGVEQHRRYRQTYEGCLSERGYSV